ncbi:patatin-like phospholipase family protein [Halosquirtibacter xylanolyticus]|uniref:patatin-like phospholipase family protein n=1 Tax=Halosquirtibacter xylanolyticus TaxID=3374599 RepID=UPI00374A899D|nr:patatin-like phospholipase family protein [Prolixibacteraceae bacterium]
MEGQKKSVGLALSGGGARGVAHMGVIKAFQEAGIPIHAVSGTSMGALVGALLANGFSPEEMLELLDKKHIKGLLHPSMKSHGLIKVGFKTTYLDEIMPYKTFEELKIPLFVSVSNITKGELEVKSQGEYLPYVIASCSIPVVFPAQEIDGQCYVDGGLYDNLPAMSLYDQCDYIVGVHVNFNGEEQIKNSMVQVAERCFQLIIGNNVKKALPHCNAIIEPHELRKYGTFDLKSKLKIFKIGYDYGRRIIKDKIIHDICS